MNYNNYFFKFVFLITYFLCEFSKCQIPRITLSSTEIIADIGDNVEFSCSIEQAERDTKVSWIKETTGHIYTVGPFVMTQDKRISVRHTATDSKTTYELKIANLQPSDESGYICDLSVSVGVKLSASVNLKMLKPPTIFNNSTMSYVVPEGGFANLDCWATGYPQPIVFWNRRDGATLPTGGSRYPGNSLIIQNVKNSDAGVYVCEAMNGVGNSAVWNTTIDIQVIRKA